MQFQNALSEISITSQSVYLLLKQNLRLFSLASYITHSNIFKFIESNLKLNVLNFQVIVQITFTKHQNWSFQLQFFYPVT